MFKVLTHSLEPSSSRPSIFDFTGRAKWDAWKAAGITWKDHLHGAETRYLEIAESLGWRLGNKEVPETTSIGDQSDSELTVEELLSQDTPPNPGTGAEGGMSVAVSSISAPVADDEDTLHGYSLSADIKGLQKLIEEGVDVNQIDDYVRVIIL